MPRFMRRDRTQGAESRRWVLRDPFISPGSWPDVVRFGSLLLPAADPAASCGVGPPVNPHLKRMYLTDCQVREIKEEAGAHCEYVELDKGIITDYGLSPERLRA